MVPRASIRASFDFQVDLLIYAMTITWHGLSCVSIRTKIGPNEEATVVLDPYDNDTGLRFPRTLEAELVVVTEDVPSANNVAAIGGKPFLITDPGEYEVKNIFVYGISVPRDNAKGQRMIANVVSEGISVAHLGMLDRMLTDGELAHLEHVDVLLVPVGGQSVLDAKRAGELIAEIEPNIVIPICYAIPNLKTTFDPIEKFLKEMGVAKGVEPLPRLKIARKDIPEETTVMVLARD